LLAYGGDPHDYLGQPPLYNARAKRHDPGQGAHPPPLQRNINEFTVAQAGRLD